MLFSRNNFFRQSVQGVNGTRANNAHSLMAIFMTSSNFNSSVLDTDNKTAFKKWFDNIKKYREEDGEYKLPYSLTSFSVEKYKPIDKASFGRMSRNTQFIFLHSENF